MGTDPRHLNQMFSGTNIKKYLDEYVANLQQALSKIAGAELERILACLRETAAMGREIYVCGNGGSSAIADHLCCDFTKGTHFVDEPVLRTISLTANTALFTACANDFGFEKAFARQIEMLGEKGDVLLAISSSGNSQNILEAVGMAREKGMKTIGFSGFTGGKLKDITDYHLHVDFKNYGVVEDSHQIIMHAIAQFLYTEREAQA